MDEAVHISMPAVRIDGVRGMYANMRKLVSEYPKALAIGLLQRFWSF